MKRKFKRYFVVAWADYAGGQGKKPVRTYREALCHFRAVQSRGFDRTFLFFVNHGKARRIG